MEKVTCRVCEELVKKFLPKLHQIHTDSLLEFKTGFAHASCPEVREWIKKLDSQIMEHALHCEKGS